MRRGEVTPVRWRSCAGVLLLVGCRNLLPAGAPFSAVNAPAQMPPDVQKSSNSPVVSAPVISPRDRALSSALAAAVRVRGLPSRRAFGSEHVDRMRMGAIVRKELVAIPQEAIRNEATEQKLLSLVAPAADYEEMVVGMVSSQVAGLYSPLARTLYVVDDDPRGSPEEHALLVHEMVHALQDEHFDLGERVRWRAESTDQTAAAHALAEGDATLAMLLDGGGHRELSDRFIADFTTGMMETNRQILEGKVPRSIADSLVSPYVYGMRFVWRLYVRGGWDAVNAAWRDPPVTTEQLLHHGKYVTHEGPVPLVGDPVGPKDFSLASAHTVGELDVRDWLGAFVASEVAESHAGAWENGRMELFARGDERALRMRIRWDADAGPTAQGLAKALAKSFQGRFGPPRTSGLFHCVERPNVGPLAWAASPRELVVLAGPASFSGGQLPTSGSSCASLRSWAERAIPLP